MVRLDKVQNYLAILTSSITIRITRPVFCCVTCFKNYIKNVYETISTTNRRMLQVSMVARNNN